jgi:hypothetical protein
MGRTHEVAVRVRIPNATIRGPRWAMMSKRAVVSGARSLSPSSKGNRVERGSSRL